VPSIDPATRLRSGEPAEFPCREDVVERRDVDPEAYVAQVINLVLCGFATHASLRNVLGAAETSDREAGDRLLREMLRVAKSSLFLPAPTDASARVPAATARA